MKPVGTKDLSKFTTSLFIGPEYMVKIFGKPCVFGFAIFGKKKKKKKK